MTSTTTVASPAVSYLLNRLVRAAANLDAKVTALETHLKEIREGAKGAGRTDVYGQRFTDVLIATGEVDAIAEGIRGFVANGDISEDQFRVALAATHSDTPFFTSAA